MVFTAAEEDYANEVLDRLDKNKYIKHRLYRQHTTNNSATYIKDLSKLGRPLDQVIIIDNLAENFQLQPENGIHIQSFYGDKTDTELQKLVPILKHIANSGSDVRPFLS